MTRMRINKIEIQGFRAFGRQAQTLDLPSSLAAVWGPNSQGKTSLAEALEFLLTGQIVRRELMASGQDEFADALRNAHLPPGTEVFVRTDITGSDGKPHTVKRTLQTDYGKKQDCQTILEVDGKVTTEASLPLIGIVLSQPPLRAPVLAQHTLGYLFSARPQDRATYFKALLEVTDLEAFRNAVTALEDEVKPTLDPLLAKLEIAAAVPEAAPHVRALLTKVPTAPDIDQALAAAAAALIKAEGQAVPTNPAARLDKLEEILAEKRAKTFPVKAFDKKPWSAWSAPTKAQHENLQTYIGECAKVDKETRRLTSLFSEALALPAVAEAAAPIECPLCGTEGALTTDRVTFIRERVKDTGDFRKAEKEAQDALTHMTVALQALEKALAEAQPHFITIPSSLRRLRGFRIDRIRSLLGMGGNEPVANWLIALQRLARARTAILKASRALKAEIAVYAADLETLTDAAGLEHRFGAAQAASESFSAVLAAYIPTEEAVAVPLKAVINAESKTTGWQELVDLAREPKALRKALVERSIRLVAQKELAQALRQIDKGNEAVLDEKFQQLSVNVETWWNLLRPDELSFFAAVKPRPGARRTIDFKAGLSANPDRSDSKLRDVIAVFSHSQLHCLGLALFIARALHDGTGFIVLDDPIVSSDEDYRAYFNTAVLEKLLTLGVQVILLTQDQRTWKDVGERYLHQNISLFQITLQSPAQGCVVDNTADDLATMLTRAEILVRGGHPDLHRQGGELLRNAAERFCKEMLVRERRTKGDQQAALSDYDGKTLGELGPKVEPLLTTDASHPGKLRVLGKHLNPAKHDDSIPGQATLKVALGDLHALKKQYL